MGIERDDDRLTVSLTRSQFRVAAVVVVVVAGAAVFAGTPLDVADVTGVPAGVATAVGDTLNTGFQSDRAADAEADRTNDTAPAKDAGDPLEGIGQPGSAHEHAVFAVAINGRRIDFSRDAFQLRDRRVHFEENNGTIIHKHATGVTIGYTLSTLNMSISDDCLVAGTNHFCEDGGNLSVFVDGSLIDDAPDHVIQAGEAIEIVYRND